MPDDGETDIFRRTKALILKSLTNKAKKEFKRADIESIVCLRYDRIGDMIVSLPFLKALRQGFPNAHTLVIASESNACVAQTSPFISETIIKPDSLLKWIIILVKLRLRNISLAVDLNHSVAPHAILAVALINAKYAASPYKEGRWGVTGSEIKLFDVMPAMHELGYRRPISECYLDIARELQCPTSGCQPYPLPKHNKPSDASVEYVILNWSGSRPSMRITLDDLQTITDVISRLRPRSKVYIPSQTRDYEFLSDVFKDSTNAQVIGPFNSICSLLPTIQFASLVITPDTALVHIAVAYHVPLIAIYTSDNELFEQWRPINLSDCITIHAQSEKSINDFPRDKLVEAIEQMLS